MSQQTSDPKIYNKSSNPSITQVMEKEVSRRSVLKGSASLAAFSFLSGLGLSGCSSDSSDDTPVAGGIELGFDSIAGTKIDAVSVPQGYTAQILAPWGTPLNNQANDWDPDGNNTSTDQLNAMGMNHDGMHFFPLENSATEGLLCINHEYINCDHLHPNGPTSPGDKRPAEEVRKEINAHGISVVHIKLEDDQWQVVKNSDYNRRFTAGTTMAVTGPVAESSLELLKTKYTTEKGDHKLARGTNNNCGNGHTPWGTYLTCEENWPDYFINHGTMDDKQERIGISDSVTRYSWETVDDRQEKETGEFSRFNITEGNNPEEDFRNEAHGFGYIVEIDPYDNKSIATKRTALGRFRHEDCSFGKLTEGQPVVFYSGHDGKFEYIYKFVSEALWNPADANPVDRLTVGAKYMDKGTLYVAQFNEEGKGRWISLVESTSATSVGETLGDKIGTLAEILLNAPLAGDLVGATKMDRPEWTAVDPESGTVYVTLTNNDERAQGNVANPRPDNKYGHIVRWNEGASATEFTWDFFLFGSDDSEDAQTNLSGLTASNEFGSPDGLAFDDRGILWVQTDGGEVDSTNDQMLAIVPSRISAPQDGSPAVNTDNQDELRRFFVGPNGCEVTGIAFSADHASLFVNLQHPGNWPPANGTTDATEETPAGFNVRPRSSTVVIRKVDGEPVGV